MTVVLVPTEFPCLTCGIVLYKDRVTIGILAYVSMNFFILHHKGNTFILVVQVCGGIIAYIIPKIYNIKLSKL